MKYDIRIKHEERGITVLDVPWATDLPKDHVPDVVKSILFQMENDPEPWQGNIIISKVHEAQIIPLPKCEIDHSGSQAQYSSRDG